MLHWKEMANVYNIHIATHNTHLTKEERRVNTSGCFRRYSSFSILSVTYSVYKHYVRGEGLYALAISCMYVRVQTNTLCLSSCVCCSVVRAVVSLASRAGRWLRRLSTAAMTTCYVILQAPPTFASKSHATCIYVYSKL